MIPEGSDNMQSLGAKGGLQVWFMIITSLATSTLNKISDIFSNGAPKGAYYSSREL